ncbi:cell division protein FtsZ [Spirosoma utsteinense]|uniref:Cell division protein FtsZ n=1 Tax=Spirosoma utsteinense TaxID=2585773 RepID=A0ABR6W735_9BACT|nr:cell division protein FtsZ [Spirosoma utsteinense]MBC3786113.1 cell division protein FtsZ [Spirosoma utsteinense]MBC3792302.1 cell division protein FtsZ [Spirosoma utsteinense]
MLSQGYRFEIPDDNPTIIKVVGVGGMGGNAVKHMHNINMKDVNFAVCNTDRQALMSNPVPTKLQLGDGLGAGTEAKAGEDAARASIEEIRSLLAPPTKMVFITAGMGGGTGTGAAPVVAEVAREMGLLTVAVVTAPYWYEGTDKKEQAREGIEKLKKSCDTVLVVLNDKLAELYSELTWTEAYAHADDVLANAVKSIAEIITTQGDINADFADVKKVLEQAGQSVMGSAEAAGEDRALRAIEAALNSPLLNDHDIRGAKRILLTISSSREHAMRLKEQMAISEHVAKKIQAEARMFKFGAITDETLKDNLRVTIIAAGFDGTTTLMDQLKGTIEPDVNLDIVVGTELPGNGLGLEESTEELVPVDADGDDMGIPVGVTDKVQEKETTMTGPGGITIVRPDSMPGMGLRPDSDDNDTLVMDDEDRPSDMDLIRRTVDAFVKGPYIPAELDRPTFERNKTLLYALPMLPEHEFVRSKLND